jgi:TPP-dependent pyruvate/acetoin dehydrogenase alpha subunit
MTSQTTAPPVSSTELADAHRAMLRIRVVEETVLDMRLAGTIVGSVHLEMGQEAVPVGVVGARDPGDAVFSTYRGHGWALACGLSVQSLLAELAGRIGGPNDGRGGSAHFSDPEHGFFGENSIVGGGVPIAVGAALAGRFDGTGRAAITVFGDGATNQGSVHESMNLAAAMRLPVLFVCENNGLSELTRIDEMVAEPELFRRAAGYGMPGLRIDGNDPFLVREAAREALDRARAGGGPTFLEVMTQRITGHYIGDPEQYWRPGELDAAKADEPLVRMRARLADAGLDEAGIEALEAPVRAEVAAARATVEALPFVDPSTAREHLYG